jgi:hypothetical protein
MEEKLNFSLPEKKQKTLQADKLCIILLLIAIVLAAANLVLKLTEKKTSPERTSSAMSAEQTKQLAEKLAQRNLYERAAEVWQDYISSARLTGEELAKALYQTATMLEKANLYDRAIEYYYRSEAAAKLDELASQINSHIKECFEKSGKFSALRYELMERTSLKAQESPAGKIIAEIGAEKITEADLDAAIEKNIDNQLRAVAEFLAPEQLKEQKAKTLERFKDPQVRSQFLQGWIAQEILYRQALEENLAERPEVKQLINDMVRGALSQKLMDRQLADKINITETDLRTYYEANKDKYVERIADPNDPNDPNKVEQRQKSFDEARQEIMMNLSEEKRRDVQQQFIKQMMDKYNVIIHTSALSGKEQDETKQ